MLGYSIGAVLDGVFGSVVSVEADVTRGLPQFHIVGLPDSAVSESRLRIRSAIRNSGFEFPPTRITINLSPASLKKRGAGLDLAIAVAILRASGQLQNGSNAFAWLGELSLSGDVVPIQGLTNLARAISEKGNKGAVVSHRQQKQCVPIPHFEWYELAHLRDLLHSVDQNQLHLQRITPARWNSKGDDGHNTLTLSEEALRFLKIAAIGRLHFMLMGPPGSGKTWLAEHYAGLLPDMTESLAIDVYGLHQAAGQAAEFQLRPSLRMPHHSLTVAGMIGGGVPPTPGEATLAHGGVLCLDELLEFTRPAIDALREPLTSKSIRLHRGGQSVVLPADFQLTTTMNPCPCGHYGFGECRCQPREVIRYWSHLSGPFLDRMDMLLHVTNTPHKQVTITRSQIRSELTLKQMVYAERVERLYERGNGTGDFTENAFRTWKQYVGADGLSQRRERSICKTARAISIVEGRDVVQADDVLEALMVRPRVMV